MSYTTLVGGDAIAGGEREIGWPVELRLRELAHPGRISSSLDAAIRRETEEKVWP